MTNAPQLANRVVILTGASAGIGRALAIDLMARGARVIANARRQDRLRELRQNAPDPERLIVVSGDASDEQVIDELFQAGIEKFGQAPNGVIVNAGRGLAGSVVASDLSQLENVLKINVTGAVRLMQKAALVFQERLSRLDWRSYPQDIVVIGSNVGRNISPFSAVYGATKFAANSLAEALRREIGPKGIRVTLVEPGIVRTEFQEVAGYNQEWFTSIMDRFNPVLDPEDVARAVAFVLEQPPHVHINNIALRPTRQDYP